jgi:FkbM family methyltransferase
LVARSVFSNPGNRRHRLGRAARGVAWQLWKRTVRRPRTIELANGTLFRAHTDCVISSALHYAAWPEFHELQWLRGVLRPGEVVLDVGANVGHISLLLADVVGPNNLFAFEPAPVAFERLCENWRLNGWPTDQLFNVAVGSNDGEVSIETATTPLTTIGVSSAPTEKGQKVGLRALDGLRDRWRGRPIGLLKVDVEGYEGEVLQGARAILAEDRPRAVMFESLAGSLDVRIGRIFVDTGYEVFQLDEHGHPDFDRKDGQNLFAVPTERLEELAARVDGPSVPSPGARSIRMRVCVCTSLEGAAEPRAPRHAAALAQLGHDVDVVFIDSSPARGERKRIGSLEGLSNLTRRTHRFASRSTAPARLALHKARQRVAQLAFRIGAAPRAEALSIRVIGLERLLEDARADVYVAHGIETLLPICRVALRSGALAVFDSMEFHSDMGDSQTAIERALTRAIERRCLPQCALVLASSDQVADALVQEYGIRRPLALYNAPPVDQEIASERNGLSLYWRNTVLGLGQRGLDDALVALTRLPADVTLHLQGAPAFDGGAALKARISALGLDLRVTVHPPHAPDEAVRAAARHSVGLCLERGGLRNHELTVSNKIFDYHMAGLAVVASDLPGLRAVMERSRGGLMFEPGSPADLAAKILTLYDNPALLKEYGANAREFALREGNRDVEMKKFVASFMEMWTTRRGASARA